MAVTLGNASDVAAILDGDEMNLIFTQDHHELTPLMLACKIGSSMEIVRLLCSSRAKFSTIVSNSFGGNALHIAMDYARKEVEDYVYEVFERELDAFVTKGKQRAANWQRFRRRLNDMGRVRILQEISGFALGGMDNNIMRVISD